MTTEEQKKDLEELLWEISTQGSDSAPAPDDSLLRAYREGHLDPETERAVERALANSRQGRGRLEQLAGAELDRPRAEVREKILAAAPGRRSPSAETDRTLLDFPNSHRRRPPGLWWMTAAATLLLALVSWRFFAPGSLPRDLQFQVSASGLAEERGEESMVGPISARPDTVVTLTMEPIGRAVERVDFALYRLLDGSLERVDTLPNVSRQVYRGAARFSARAALLAGPQGGSQSVFLVAARPGNLPHHLEIPGTAEAEAVLRGNHRRRVVRQLIQFEVGASR